MSRYVKKLNLLIDKNKFFALILCLFFNHLLFVNEKALWADFFCINALILAFDDCQHFHIPIWPIILIACGGVGWLFCQQTCNLGLPVFLIFLGFFAYGNLTKIGTGDIALLGACSFWFLSVGSYGLFLFMAGGLGVCAHFMMWREKIPFAPAILIACWVCFAIE
jgi:hypothetical protein